MARLHQSPSSILHARMGAWGDTPLREMGFALATKLKMLPHVVARLEKKLDSLGEYLKDETAIDECLSRNAVYVVRDGNLPYEILIDVDSFLFESRSAHEIVGKFLREFFDRILDKQVNETDLQALLRVKYLDTRCDAVSLRSTVRAGEPADILGPECCRRLVPSQKACGLQT